MKLKSIIGISITMIMASLAAENQLSFDKQEYQKTVWSQANPWFPPNVAPPNRTGGTDYAWHEYSSEPQLMWKKVAEVCKPYGMTGIQMEVSLRDDGIIHHMEALKPMLDGFQSAGNGFKGMPFITTVPAKNRQTLIKTWEKYFDATWPILATHPNAFRINGMPVMTSYRVDTYSVEDWQYLRKHLEKKYGKFIILFNTWMGAFRKAPNKIIDYLKVFDGVTAYAAWTIEAQREHMKMLTKIMKEQFPDKIFEAAVHNTYTQHFNYGGNIPEFTEKYRNSLVCALEAKPDSLVLTNFFDIYENSRILPSYEYEDVLLELLRWYTASWRQAPYYSQENYNFYLSNFISIYAGDSPRFEFLALPGKMKHKADVKLEVADAAGKVLYTSATIIVTPGTFKAHKWVLPTLQFAAYRELYPRLVVNGKKYDFSPPTMIDPSLRSHLLWYTRSIKNQLSINKGSKTWIFCGGQPGSCIKMPNDGFGYLQAAFTSLSNGTSRTGGSFVRLLRNGAEFMRFKRWNADLAESLQLPSPGATCDSYSLELVNKQGIRYRTPSIYLSGKRFGKKVSIPIVTQDQNIHEIEFQADRVPYYYYPCNIPCGSLLIDCSGYSHDGFMGGTGYGGGHLLRTGYRHEHIGGLRGETYPHSPSYVIAENNTFLHFSGNDYICLQGGTMFPYASTIELEIRPIKNGTMGILGAGNNQIQLMLREDGKLLVARSTGNSPALKQFVSDIALKYNQWSHIAVVYDCNTLIAYINGKVAGKMKIAPSKRHEIFNAMVLGATCKNLNQPDLFYKGDMRNVRIYGRALSPHEFLIQ